jgi:hypothetical protein
MSLTYSLHRMSILEERVFAFVFVKWFGLVEELSILLNIIPCIEAFSLLKV